MNTTLTLEELISAIKLSGVGNDDPQLVSTNVILDTLGRLDDALRTVDELRVDRTIVENPQ